MEQIEVTDPCHPLFGRRFEVHSVTGGDTHSARVYVKDGGDRRLMILREATSLSVLVRMEPRSKLCASAVKEFLALVKEYELCPRALKTSGGGSARRCKTKSSLK